MSRVEPNRNVYVGHRYVPKIFGEWDKKNQYEGLSIVTHQGNSYTSKKRVPIGIDILNEEFWVVTGNYDAQIEYYREEVKRVSQDLLLKADKTYVDTELGKKSDITYVDTELDKKSDITYVDTELDNVRDDIISIKNDVSYYGALTGSDKNNTVPLTNALNEAVYNKKPVNIDDHYYISDNIPGFMGTDRSTKLMFDGTGSIQRGDDIFYISPKGDEKNSIYVSGNNHHMNDGLTRDKPVAFTTAIKFLSDLGDKALNGHWSIKFVGIYNGRGFENEKLPYFKNPILFEGETDLNNDPISIIDGSGVNSPYFFRADTGSGFAKMFTFKNLYFKNFDLNTSSAGAIVVWDNIDVLVENCRTLNCSRFIWARNGRLRAFDNICENGHSGIACQYHTSFNVERNTFIGFTAYGVHQGRNSAGHFRENTFRGNRVNIDAVQSSRLRTIENIHEDWEFVGVNLGLNATWEGMADEVILYNYNRENPFYRTYYGSTLPQVESGGTPMVRHAYKYPSNFLNVESDTVTRADAHFTSPLRLNDSVLFRENTHIKIKLLVHSYAHAGGGYDFDIILSNSNEENGYLTIPIKTTNVMVGEIEIDLYAREGSTINYCVVKYPDGEFVKTKHLTYNTHGVYNNKNELKIARMYINNKGNKFNMQGLNTYISQ